MDFNKICTACLCEADSISDMNATGVLQKFLSFTDLTPQVEIPTNICKACEEKLNIAVDFKDKCQKSIERLLNHLKNDHLTKNDLNANAKASAEPDASTRASKLERFDYDEVSQAIEDSQRGFRLNTNCIRCSFIGSNGRALSVHVSLVHRDLKERWCSGCNAEYADLPGHVAEHHGEDVACRLCAKIFRNKGHLTEHLRSHSGVRPFRCTSCDKSFISRRHLNVHSRKHTDERPYKCGLCDKSFTQLNLLKQHLTGHGDESFSQRSVLQNYCCECDKKVRSLVLHTERFHSPVKTDGLDKLCTVCGKQFKTNSKLRVHMRVHTGETPYKCSYCDKKVTTRNQLVVHERTHTGERPHVCHVCGKNFAQSSVLNTHMRLHTGPTIKCKICDQRFCRPAQLRLHLRRHTGEKPFVCSECGQAFIQRSHLVEHNKTHSDLRPHQCTYCDKAFKQSSSLKSHVRIHLGEKPYKCNQCPYAGRQSYSLTQHMKQHNLDKPRSEKPHQCTMCNKVFTTSAMLNSHFNIDHNAVFLGT